jgi:hypothetical protein
MWSNADEVGAFIEGHKDVRWAVGDKFCLPDIEQYFEVIGVRPFKHRGKFKLFVDLEARCAIETCEEYFITTKEVHQWMSSPHLTRCCEAHRFQFSTNMRDAWKTEAQRLARPVKAAKVKAPPRVGRVEGAVLRAAEDLAVVADSATVADLVKHAIGKLAAGTGRDTRRQMVVRAVQSLVRSGGLRLASGRVVFGTPCQGLL